MINEDFKKAVAKRNMDDIRVFLRMRLTLDHNYVSGLFAEHLVYCLSHGISEDELYQKYDGRALPQTNSEKVFAELVGHLSTNFAKERVKRIIEIGKALCPEEQMEEGRKQERDSFSKVDANERHKQFEKGGHYTEKDRNFGKKTEDGRRVVSVREITPKESDSDGAYRDYDDSGKRHNYSSGYEYSEENERRKRIWDESNSSKVSPALIVALIAAGVGVAVIIGLLFS